jgi:FkbM family methyltransferase
VSRVGRRDEQEFRTTCRFWNGETIDATISASAVQAAFQVNCAVLPNANTITGRALRLPLRLVPKSAAIPILSGIARGMKWRVGAHTHGCWLGIYEIEKQRAVRGLFRRGMTAIDVGANAGFYTLAFAAMGASRVFAIEPLPRNLEQLRAHVRMNGLRNVSVIEAAASASTGTAHFCDGPNHAMAHLSESGTLTVPTTTLDALGIIPDVVKIDVEGAELAVLQGSARILSARRTTWVIALDGAETREEVLDVLRHAGLSVVEFAPNEVIASPR